MGDMITLLKLKCGQFLLVKEIIPEEANVVGRAIQDLHLPEVCVFAGIIRQGGVVVPHGMMTLEGGNEGLAVTKRNGASALAEIIGAHSHNVKAG